MICPRCSHDAGDAPACARCGVVFAKLRPRTPTAWPTARPAEAPAEEEQPTSSRSPALIALGVVALACVVAFALARRKPAPDAAAPVAAEAPAAEGPGAEALPPPSLAPIEVPAAPVAPVTGTGMSDEDKQLVNATAVRINARGHVEDRDLDDIEAVLARNPGEPAIQQVLVAGLLARAGQDQAARRHAEAIRRLDRALVLDPGNVAAMKGRVQSYLEQADWRGAEAAARELLARQPGDRDATFSLGFALVRQDRGREALELLQPASDDPRIAALVDRVRRDLRSEGGFTEQNLSHFHVRYDGGEHDEVGREVLRALERHYATLTRTFDHQPDQPIAVILFSQEAYGNASGAPAWSGGVYDGLDGKIRIPIGGLTRSLTPDMDGTVIHELAHAFMWDMSRGAAPREIQEGVAQYLEGRRAERELPEQYLTALADGRLGGVGGYYAAALSFTEFLMAQRGQGSMNELLKAMGSGSSVDDAFQRVYGRNMRGMQDEWAQRLRQQHGSS